tara:strand:+ start:4719 stop:5102 length:384 start_codon:yes stop_codon:yes gene_type:complete
MKFLFGLVIGMTCAGLSLSGCMSVKDVQSKPVLFEGESGRSVDEVAGCVVALMQSGPGVLVTSTPLKNGVSIVQSVNGQFGNTVFMLADVTRDGEKSILSVRGIGRPPKNIEKAHAPWRACLGNPVS